MSNIKLDEISQEKVSKLPFIMRSAVNMLLDAIDNIVNGNCNEEEVIKGVNTVKDNSQGRYSDDELVNYDDACRILGVSLTNRVKLKKILDDNNIHQVKMNNMSVGFPKKEIEELSKRNKCTIL